MDFFLAWGLVFGLPDVSSMYTYIHIHVDRVVPTIHLRSTVYTNVNRCVCQDLQRRQEHIDQLQGMRLGMIRCLELLDDFHASMTDMIPVVEDVYMHSY